MTVGEGGEGGGAATNIMDINVASMLISPRVDARVTRLGLAAFPPKHRNPRLIVYPFPIGSFLSLSFLSSLPLQFPSA